MKKREELFERTKISEIKFKQTYIKKIELSENGVLSSEEIAEIIKALGHGRYQGVNPAD